MSEWWTYRPEDFLLFSPRVYFRLFELHNEALWPGQFAALALLAVLVWLAAARPANHVTFIAALLGFIWVFVGRAFVLQRYATINWAAEHMAQLFSVEMLLLFLAAGFGGLRGGPAGIGAVAGWFLIALATAQPLLAPLSGRGWASAEVFAIAPDPTAIATLGLLLTLRGPMTWVLVPIPLLWCAVSALTLWTMGEPAFWLPFAAVLATLAALLAHAARNDALRSPVARDGE